MQNRAGIQSLVSLSFPNKNSQEIEIYSSCPKNVYLPKKSIDNKFKLSQNSINIIQVQSKTFNSDLKRVVVCAIGKLSKLYFIINLYR
jgi:hypothetical protein